MRTAAPAPVLPIVAAPFPDETVASFTTRLATVNHLPPKSLTRPVVDLAGLLGVRQPIQPGPAGPATLAHQVHQPLHPRVDLEGECVQKVER
jgi:hypothetical protein